MSVWKLFDVKFITRLAWYVWQLPKNKPMSVVECIERLDMDGKSIYKESMIRLIEAVA